MEAWTSLFAIAFGLSADALAVTISNCLNYPTARFSRKLLMPTLFGVFQGAMPLLGFLLGAALGQHIEAFDHWIALVLLTFLGVKAIVECYKSNKEERELCGKEIAGMPVVKAVEKRLTIKTLLVQSVATSIDALAVGVTLAGAVAINIFASVAIITAVTFVVCLAGIFIGKVGKVLKQYAGYVGGGILIAIGVKIFLEHILG
jgi:putative Mn2+ efflux pump MntP